MLVVPLALGVAALVALGLWLLEPALAPPAVLAAALPAIVALTRERELNTVCRADS